jgi:hypothetical protein
MSGFRKLLPPRDLAPPPMPEAASSFPPRGRVLTAVALLRTAKAAGLRFVPDGARLRLKADHPPQPDLLARLREHKPELLALLGREACRQCGGRLGWPLPGGVAFSDGTAACHDCYRELPQAWGTML